MHRFRRSACLATFALLGLSAPGWANVGVTSVTSGDPLGQPPAQAERVLRVGVDVQANERVTTKATDRAHLVFLDGTALTVGPNSSLVIDKFVYDPDRKLGELSLSTAKGVFRLVGGNISKTNDIKVTTPSASIGIRGGIATFEVADGGGTKATFLYGDRMTVTGQGQTQVATRHGTQISATTGRPPTPPAPVPPGGLAATGAFERAPANAVTGPAAAPAAAQVRAPVVTPVQTPILAPVAIAAQTQARAPVVTPVAVAPAVVVAQVNTALAASSLINSNSGLQPSNLRQEAQNNHQNRSHKVGGPARPQAGGAKLGTNVLRVLRPGTVAARSVANNNNKPPPQQPARR